MKFGVEIVRAEKSVDKWKFGRSKEPFSHIIHGEYSLQELASVATVSAITVKPKLTRVVMTFECDDEEERNDAMKQVHEKNYGPQTQQRI